MDGMVSARFAGNVAVVSTYSHERPVAFFVRFWSKKLLPWCFDEELMAVVGGGA